MGLIIYNHPHALNHVTLLAKRLRRSPQTSVVTQGSLGLRISRLLRFQCPHFLQWHQEKKEEITYLVDMAITCD